MPERVNNIPPAGDKEREEVSVSATNESGPPKKKYRYECSADGCTNIVINGGVCMRHGAKKKLCSVKECTRYAKQGGVCVRHGAKVKRCIVEECPNKAVSGGLCVKHGAKVKRCSVDECNNNVIKGGVCVRHGAKNEHKRCSVDECSNKAIKGGVCFRHGAKKRRCSVEDCTKYAQNGGVCVKHGAMHKRCSVDDCTNQARKGRVRIRHGAKVKRCSHEGCTNQRQRRGVSNIAPPAQGNFLCGEVQGVGNQNNASTVVAISDNEEEGGKKQSPIAGRKRKADNVGKQSKTAASNDAEEDGPVRERSKEPTRRSTRLSTLSKPNCNEDAACTELEGNVDGNEEGEEATDHAPSDMGPQKRARGEGNLKDDNEQDASDVTSTQGGSEEGTGDATEDGDSWGGDGQNEYDCGGGDDGDVNSEEGKQSHVVPDEIVTTTGANDVEKDSEIQRLATELKDANNTVDTLNDRLKEMSNEFEAAQSRSKSEHEQQQSELKDLRNELDILSSQSVKKTEDAARLETSLRSKEVEMESAVLASAAQLKEANDKVDELSAKLEQADKDGNEKIQRQINNFHLMQEEKRSLQSKILHLEQQLRSSKSEQDNLKTALAKAASKNQTHCTRSTSISSRRKRFSKKNRLLGVPILSTLREEGTTSITSSRKRLGKKNRLLGVDSLQQMML